MGNFTFKGKSSEDYGLVVERLPRRTIPRLRVTEHVIPGRQGALHQTDGTYEPYVQEYVCWFKRPANYSTLARRIHDVAQWLTNLPVISRLEDSYDTQVWHNAIYLGGADVENICDRFGRFTVSFQCDPRGYLTSADLVINITGAGLLNNPTSHTAAPLIEVDTNGKLGGVVRIGEYSVNLLFGTVPATTVYIDCEIREAWYVEDGVQIGCNHILSSPNWPLIVPGSNRVEISGLGVDTARVHTRVWKL